MHPESHTSAPTPPLGRLHALPPHTAAPRREKKETPDTSDILSDEDSRRHEKNLPTQLAILPLRNTVLFPGVVIPITVARDKSIRLVREAFASKHRMIGVVAQREPDVESPTPDDLHTVGTAAAILRQFKMPDGSITIVLQGRTRFEVARYLDTEPYLRAEVAVRKEVYPGPELTDQLMMDLKLEASHIIEVNPNIPTEAINTLNNIDNLAFLVHFIAANLHIEVPDKQRILETPSLEAKCALVLEFMKHEAKVLEVSEEIQHKVRSDIDKQQREFILRQQMKNIQEELGERSHEAELDAYVKRAEAKQWPEAARAAFQKELDKLYRTHPGSPEFAVAVNYIEWLLDLPWQEYTQDHIDLALARQVLEEDHYGLEKVKERIIEYLAVLKLKGDMRSPILCLYGPPGVGKTSLGKSIARATGRKFVRMSLGGVRDEAEIRGHRRTYIGAMPGRVLQGLKKAATGNPVFILDEIDKLGNDFRGDPSSALLEVLDPEQNDTFNDHYIELDYDLRPILFIATANSLETLHPALRDRMEIIEINGYTQEEKLEIAKRHLIPRALADHGLKAKQVKFTDDALRLVIDRHTRESGVRTLHRKLADVCRGVAVGIVEGKFKSLTVTPAKVEAYLGAPRFESETYQRVDRPGVAVGLAWTPVGGEILFIESTLLRGRGHLHLTGSLGDVMKESAHLAHTWLRSQAPDYKINPAAFENWDIHLHIPAGAIPKDGPSAGVAMLTALASAYTQRRARPEMAMTGEITLRGKVLPVGGIKEKVLAARRAGVTTLLLPAPNRKDVLEIKPTHLLEGLTIHYVTEMSEVLALALEPDVVANPLEVVGRTGEGIGLLRPRYEQPQA
jgi:ATP-dependent Lon protease